MYPIILIIVAIVAVTVMLWLVVPTFAAMFKDMGATPAGYHAVCRRCLGVHRQVRHLYRDGCRGRGLCVPSIYENGRGTPAGRWDWPGPAHGRRPDGAGGHVPLCFNIGLLLKSGIPMLETMSALQSVFHMIDISGRSGTCGRTCVCRPSAGRGTGETGLFTTMMTNMVKIGEESGQLSSVMDQIARPYYKEDGRFHCQANEVAGTDHHHGNGQHDRRPDAGHLSAYVRNGW